MFWTLDSPSPLGHVSRESLPLFKKTLRRISFIIFYYSLTIYLLYYLKNNVRYKRKTSKSIVSWFISIDIIVSFEPYDEF